MAIMTGLCLVAWAVTSPQNSLCACARCARFIKDGPCALSHRHDWRRRQQWSCDRQAAPSAIKCGCHRRPLSTPCETILQSSRYVTFICSCESSATLDLLNPEHTSIISELQQFYRFADEIRTVRKGTTQFPTLTLTDKLTNYLHADRTSQLHRPKQLQEKRRHPMMETIARESARQEERRTPPVTTPSTI